MPSKSRRSRPAPPPPAPSSTSPYGPRLYADRPPTRAAELAEGSYIFRPEGRANVASRVDDRIRASLDRQGREPDALRRIVEANVVHPDVVLRLAGIVPGSAGFESIRRDLLEAFFDARGRGLRGAR